MMMSRRNTPEQAGGQKDKAWEEIAPTEIERNPVRMIDEDILGRVSGRDGNKVAGAGLTVEFTELGVHYMYIGEIVHVWKK